MHGVGCRGDPAGVVTKQWLRFVAVVDRRDVTFFLITVAVVALLTTFGL